jgi:DNA-binding SARP family transcriptional activator
MEAVGALGSLNPIPRLPDLAALGFIHAEAAPALRLEVIGSMRVWRGADRLNAVGGPKAGTHQAAGLLAFLFDRDTRGVDKDEAIELIWPESPLPVGDTAFHRTMLGLRRTLATDGVPDVIQYRAGRYFLADGVVGSSDLADLEDLLEASADEPNPRQRTVLLERCRTFNRGAYMDDCPFYGTSTFVEVRRSLVRSVMTAVLRELGDLYLAEGHGALAALRHAEIELVP